MFTVQITKETQKDIEKEILSLEDKIRYRPVELVREYIAKKELLEELLIHAIILD